MTDLTTFTRRLKGLGDGRFIHAAQDEQPSWIRRFGAGWQNVDEHGAGIGRGCFNGYSDGDGQGYGYTGYDDGGFSV